MYDKLPEDSVCWESMTERESQEELELYAAAAKLPLQLNLPEKSSVKGVEGDYGQDEVGVRYHFRIAQGECSITPLLSLEAFDSIVATMCNALRDIMH